jgi:hypothetical protein
MKNLPKAAESIVYAQTMGAKHGWPAVRLKKGQVLQAGKENWHKFLTHARSIQLQMLDDALWRGWSEGVGCVGMIRE